MKIQQFIFSFLLVMFLCGFGCSSSKPAPDPLAGWKLDFAPQLDPVIAKDCQDYIQKLPSDEKGYSHVSGYFDDGTGQHAVEIEVFVGGTESWHYAIFYDKENKRVKVVKYGRTRYMS